MISKHVVRKLNFGLKALLLVISIIAVAVVMTFGQAHRPFMKASPKVATQPAMKELPVYDLVVSKNEPKFTVAKPPSKKYPDGNLDRESNYINMEGLPMGSLAFALMRQLGRSVVDKTGLTEKYDLILRWSPDERTTPMSNRPDNLHQGMAQSPDSSEPSIFTAIQEQLGLRLVPSKGPVECVFIAHIERPSEN